MPTAVSKEASADGQVLPGTVQLQALDELVTLGYYRGIVRKLDEIAALDHRHAGFVEPLRVLAQQFQLEAMARVIRQALAARSDADEGTRS